MKKVNDAVVYICNEGEGDQVTFSDRDTSNGFCGLVSARGDNLQVSSDG